VWSRLVDGVWSRWSDWSECSATCGGGIRIQTRNCIPPLYGGEWCKGSNVSTEECNLDACIGKIYTFQLGDIYIAHCCSQMLVNLTHVIVVLLV